MSAPKPMDLVEYNAINQRCPPEILDRYRQAKALLDGTGFIIIEKYYSPAGQWRKPKCPDCNLSIVTIDERRDGGQSPGWVCWTCGAHLYSTERDEPMKDDRPAWQKR